MNKQLHVVVYILTVQKLVGFKHGDPKVSTGVCTLLPRVQHALQKFLAQLLWTPMENMVKLREKTLQMAPEIVQWLTANYSILRKIHILKKLLGVGG